MMKVPPSKKAPATPGGDPQKQPSRAGDPKLPSGFKRLSSPPKPAQPEPEEVEEPEDDDTETAYTDYGADELEAADDATPDDAPAGKGDTAADTDPGDEDEIVDIAEIVKAKLAKGGVDPLRPLWLKKEPTTLYFLGTKSERVMLHFNREVCEIPKGSYRCPKVDCPVCEHVERAQEHYLFPVLSLADGTVYTLQVQLPPPGGRQEAHELYPQIERLIADGRLTTMAMMISAEGRKVTIVPKPIKAEAAGNLPAAKAFGKAYAKGKLRLRHTFNTYTPAELARLPAVRTGIQMKDLVDFGPEDGDDA